MAEGFARFLGNDQVIAKSAGSRPSGRVNPKAIAAMAQLGIDIAGHESKSVEEMRGEEWDYVITMGCGDECPFLQAKHHQDWALQDPRHLEGEEFNQVRDDIRQRVIALLTSEGYLRG